jgi:hypothetical protein
MLTDLGKGLDDAGGQVREESPWIGVGFVHAIPGEPEPGPLEEVHQE